MKTFLNTLYVTTEGAWVRLDHETLKVEVNDAPTFQVPLHHIGALVCFGDVMVTPAALHRCAADGRSVTWLDRHGRFSARVEGPVSGNVLLRREQHAAHRDPARSLRIARVIVAAKLQAQRIVLVRGARDCAIEDEIHRLDAAEIAVRQAHQKLAETGEMAALRGYEGIAARRYFDAFGCLIKSDRAAFGFAGRTRRPPLDRVNALLSFVYTLLTHDCASALEGVGLDPQLGFFHELRPGRPSLALDLVEELRPSFADRLVLNMINLREVQAADFEERPGGSIFLTKEGRKQVLTAYQKRKQEEVHHLLLDAKVPWGILPHVQARVMARHLRGDLPEYVPFVGRS